MTADELQLFDMIDSTRKNNGCAPLEQDPSLTNSAEGTAGSRAQTGSGMNDSAGSQVGAGGDKMTAQQAYNDLMQDSRATVLNCGLKTLGVGFSTKRHCTLFLLGCTDRNVWVANFS